MGTLYLVRHGQASFGAANYDQLSELGQQQSVRLGQYLASHNLAFDAVLTGTLQRHAQTWAGIAHGAALSLPAQLWPGLNEYDSTALIHAIHPAPLPKPNTPELHRQYFRLLREALAQWMAGTITPQGMPSHSDFVSGIVAALDHVRKHHSGNVLLVSSGGPIATAVGHILGTPTATVIELNLRIRNSAVTEFAYTPKRHMLLSYNTLPHLNQPGDAALISYA